MLPELWTLDSASWLGPSLIGKDVLRLGDTSVNTYLRPNANAPSRASNIEDARLYGRMSTIFKDTQQIQRTLCLSATLRQ